MSRVSFEEFREFWEKSKELEALKSQVYSVGRELSKMRGSDRLDQVANGVCARVEAAYGLTDVGAFFDVDFDDDSGFEPLNVSEEGLVSFVVDNYARKENDPKPTHLRVDLTCEEAFDVEKVMAKIQQIWGVPEEAVE